MKYLKSESQVLLNMHIKKAALKKSCLKAMKTIKQCSENRKLEIY